MAAMALTPETLALLDALPHKRRAFVLEFAQHGNATRAMIAAGFAERTAGRATPMVLKNSGVQAALTAVRRELAAPVLAEAQISVERVLREYARIAFADMRRYASVNERGGVALVDSAEWTDDDAAAVAEVGETVTQHGGSKRFKLHDKVRALNALAEHLGILTGGTNVNVLNLPPGMTIDDVKRLRDSVMGDGR